MQGYENNKKGNNETKGNQKEEKKKRVGSHYNFTWKV